MKNSQKFNSGNKLKLWTICRILVFLIIIITLSPIIIPIGIYKPSLWGIPYTLWTGIVVTVLIVLLTVIGAKVHPGITK